MNRRQLPEGWEVKNLDQISTIKGGKRVPKGYKFETIQTSHPYITVADFTENGTVQTKNLKYISNEVYEQIKNYTISSQDIYISIAGTIGKTGSVPEILDGANLTKNACKLKPNRELDKNFVYYFTKTDDFVQQTGINTRVAAQPKLALVRLKTITLPVPPLDEQKRIVSILDEAFEGIDQAIHNTEKNLVNARELFDSYLNKIFTQKGDTWDEKRLADIAEVQSGGTPSRSKSNYWGGEMAWYSSGELNNLYTNKPERTITDEGLVNSNAKLFPKGSLLVGMYDTAALKMSILDREATFNQAIAGVKPNKKIDLVFILHAINFVKPEILSLRRGVRQKNLSLQKIKDISITIPDLEEQKKVVLQLASIKKETQRLETIHRQKIAALNELKQSILQKAFTGQLTK